MVEGLPERMLDLIHSTVVSTWIFLLFPFCERFKKYHLATP